MKNWKTIVGIVLALAILATGGAVIGKKMQSKKSVSASDLEYVKKKGTLVVGITDYPPINFKNDKGEWTGFDTEFANKIGEKLGVKVEFKEIDWGNKFTELDAKGIDCIWNGMTITNEAKLNASVSIPYASNSQVVVMKKSELTKYNDKESIKNLKFACENGSAGQEALKELGIPESNITAIDTQSNAMLELKSGAVNCTVIDSIMANTITKEGNSYSDCGFVIKLSNEQFGIAFRKNSDITDKVNAYIAELTADGTLKSLSEKYSVDLA